MANQKVSDMTTRAPQSTDLLMLAVEDVANYKATVPTFGKVFYPEWYGAVGDGVTDDTEAVQDAIDAASVDGGVVQLAQTYAIAYTATQSMAGYAVPYGLWVNADNVCLRGPGTLVPHTAATVYVLVAIGNGGAVAGHPGEAGTWTYNSGVVGLNCDGTGFDAGVSGVGFYYCKGFYAINCRMVGMSGRYSIGGEATMREGRIIGNSIINSAAASHNYHAINFDGATYCIIQGNYIGSANGNGITIQANLDNLGPGVCKFNSVSGNVLYYIYASGIRLIGSSYSAVSSNYIFLPQTVGIDLVSWSSVAYEAESSYNVVTGNYINRVGNAGIGIRCAGENVSVYDGNPLLCRGNFFAGNYIAETYLTGFFIGQQANSNIITPDNIWDTVGTFTADDTTPSVSAGFNVYKTANVNPTTVTMLDDGYVGQRVTVLVQDANTTIDFTGTNLKGNAGGDWNPANGDLMTCTFDGTNWYCDVIDAT